MEWVLVASLIFVNGVEGTAEFTFPTEESCNRTVIMIEEGWGGAPNLLGLEELNVTCEPTVSTPEEEGPEIDLY